MKTLLAMLVLVAPTFASDKDDIEIAMAMASAVAPTKSHAAPLFPIAPVVIDWRGVDPPGWHRHKSGDVIITHRTPTDRRGRRVGGTDADHTFPDGTIQKADYKGPLPPTEVPYDYPLIVPANKTRTEFQPVRRRLDCPT
jgi:hypothetical protein